MRTWIVGTIIVLGTLLGGCATSSLFDIEGAYSVTGTVTESTTPTYTEGDVVNDDFVVAESSGMVFVGVTNGTLKGTRNGNTVDVAFLTAETSAEFTLTWTSDTTFEGVGRTENLSTGTYWEYDLSGSAASTATTASTGSGFLD